MSLEILTHDSLLPTKHGFFTRKGGASSGVFAGLNCGQGSSDQADMVHLNRQRVATAMDLQVDSLVSVHQCHSADVVLVENPFDKKPKVDAMVTRTPGLALGILTADCQPVLFADREAGVVGAAHAGWQGALYGVLEATIEAMVDHGAQRNRITAVIGPCISQRAYEVGPDFFETFVAEDDRSTQYFANGRGDRLQFDLPGFGLMRLREAGVAASWTGHCTYTDPDRFFSYRRSVHQKEADYGRLIACIRL
ncbi:peptidoglycan editing factor PgeF [Algirhabdus cladophorae]|uniref:peptidoglycan editing factor PgeF n=1 Tax=Algirhabdus cladophorae TaxID=3377108 RepID=UPI003B84A290